MIAAATTAGNVVVLCCPLCGTDAPEGDLTSIVRFYSGDEGLGVTCPGCAASLFWSIRIQARKA